MGMNVGSHDDDDVLLDVNMTPLIDVMLVLIIMFIITIPIPNNAININLPNGAPPPQSNEKPPEIINLKLDAQGKIFWNGQPVENKQALENLFMTVSKKSEQDQIKPRQIGNIGNTFFRVFKEHFATSFCQKFSIIQIRLLTRIII